MAPQPSKEDLEFLERKEELIIAKQLRACRVSILPKVTSSQGHKFKRFLGDKV